MTDLPRSITPVKPQGADPQRYGLTHRQAECMRFIEQHIEASGVSPTYDEIKTRLGLSSKSRVYFLVSELVARGHLVRLPGKCRTLAPAAHLRDPKNPVRDALCRIISIAGDAEGADTGRLRDLIRRMRQIAFEGLKA